MNAVQPSVSVVVMADRDPKELPTCLKHLENLRTGPDEIVVVPRDAACRQAGIEATTGEILVFLDATSRVEPDWLEELLAPYRDSAVAAVGGRVIYGDDDGGNDRIGEIGSLLPNGSLTTHFGADPGRPVEADHLPSANVSFRRSALHSLGRVHPHYRGRSYREVTETSLRLSAAGARLIFQPAALVRAPSLDFPPGRNYFKLRDGYFHDRDHVVVLVQALGWRSPLLPRFAWTTVRGQQDQLRRFIHLVAPRGSAATAPSAAERRTAPKALLWIATEISGLAAGFPAAAAAAQRAERSRTR